MAKRGGPRLYTPDQEIRARAKFKAMREKGSSYREIAKKYGLSRETVARIIAGRKQPDSPEDDVDDDRQPVYLTFPYYCRGCSNHVHYKPCMICRTRKYVEKMKRLRNGPQT